MIIYVYMYYCPVDEARINCTYLFFSLSLSLSLYIYIYIGASRDDKGESPLCGPPHKPTGLRDLARLSTRQVLLISGQLNNKTNSTQAK